MMEWEQVEMVPEEPEAVLRRIQERAAEFDPQARVQSVRDGGGYLVRVVSGRFEGIDQAARHATLALPAMQAGSGQFSKVHTWELLTPAEADWEGELATEAGDPPLWSTVLSKGPAELTAGLADQVVFASDLDAELDSAPVVTFYSLKGGVGRSTALVAVAHVLSRHHGLRVMCVDLDLEAPGLSSLFGIDDQLAVGRGALAALLGYEFSESLPVLEHVVPVGETGRLYCLPAGRLDSDYAVQLRALEPEVWYRESGNPLHRLLDELRASTVKPDVVLIDSRTGISPVAAPLLFDVSDMAVVCFHPHSQARSGTELLTRALLSSRTRREAPRPLSPEPRFVVSPMPVGPSSVRLAERARGWVEEWVAPVADARESSGGLGIDDLTHFVPYDTGVVFEDTVGRLDGGLEPYARIADWVVQIVPERNAGKSQPSFVSKSEVLQELDFSTGTAEALPDEQFLQDYLVTRQVSETGDPDVPLILGRKGTGKTALFRWLAAGNAPGWQPVLVSTPNGYRERPDWSFGSESHRFLGQGLQNLGLGWEGLWPVVMAMALFETAPETRTVGSLPGALVQRESGELGAARAVLALLQSPTGALECREWLERVDSSGHRCLLMFDGLDTAFGHGPLRRELRAEAIAGLLVCQAELSARLNNLRMKIMLRQDIWQGLRFENKSHYYGLSRRLQWEEREEYFKVVLKRAVRASAFARMLAETDPSLDAEAVASWTPEQVHAAWNTLVGERMRGQGTAFTTNWVWNRLADGNGDHTPRALLQLFHAAHAWEQREERRSGYDRSVLRPRSLALNLEPTSVQAVSALLDEEFQELHEVAEALGAYGRTPVGENDLGDFPDELLTLAQESGLLSRLQEEGPERIFRVPDLYRWGLGVTRRGPI